MTKRIAICLCLIMLTGCPRSADSNLDVAAEDVADTRGQPSELSEELPPVCPPPPPYGLDLGDRLAPLEFLGSAGEPVGIHDFCGEPLTLIYHFYGW